MKYAGMPMAMWIAYYNAYQNKAAEKAAWPAAYSVTALKAYLDELSYEKEVKVIVYPHGNH